MNFVGEDEAEDQMKELHWEYGYVMFWIVASCLTGIMLFLMYRMGAFTIFTCAINLLVTDTELITGFLKQRTTTWTEVIDGDDK